MEKSINKDLFYCTVNDNLISNEYYIYIVGYFYNTVTFTPKITFDINLGHYDENNNNENNINENYQNNYPDVNEINENNNNNNLENNYPDVNEFYNNNNNEKNPQNEENQNSDAPAPLPNYQNETKK